MAFWKNLFDPIPEEGYDDEPKATPTKQTKKGKPGVADYLRKARHFVDPDGKPKKSYPEEFQYLADKVGFTPPAGMKFREQVEAFNGFLFGKKSSTKNRQSGAPGFIDELVEAWGITPDPAADSEQKLKLVEDMLDKDPAVQKDKSLQERLFECWDETFGTTDD